MKINWGKALSIVIEYLPNLIMLAEGLFSWKSKSGEAKKEFVTESAKSIVGAIAEESTGGQGDTWDALEEPIGELIDGTVSVMNAAGVFNSGVDSYTSGIDND